MPSRSPEPLIPSITAKTLMAMIEAPRAKPAKRLHWKQREALERRISILADELHEQRGTRRQGAIVIHGEPRSALVAEAVRTIAPAWSYRIDRKGRDERIILLEQDG